MVERNDGSEELVVADDRGGAGFVRKLDTLVGVPAVKPRG
jgi:hypothetical protein